MASTLIVREMYGGKYTVIHNPVARGRQPRYLVNGTEKPKGVTTIIGQTLNKDLMQWAVDSMKEYLVEKLPKITQEDIEEGAREYIRRRDSGASTGTEAHALVEGFLKGTQPATGDLSREALNAYNAFVDWFGLTEPEVVNVEEVVYSPTFEYAGTYDAMLRINGKVYLSDLKTTNASRRAPNGVYAENFIQLGAYALAHDEQREYEKENGGTELPEIDGLMVISAKKDGILDIVTNDDVEMSVDFCKDTFKKVKRLYEYLTDTTRLLGGK